MKSRVSSTVTKRTSNPRPRKYASASERQAAYRARAPEVCFRAEAKTVETLDRIAETLDQSRADVLLSMTKFALANHDWARFGLTHKPLPFEYGVNPIMDDDVQRIGIFNVRYVRKGEQLGPRNKSGKTIGPAAEPVVEFYDSRYPHTMRGQFVSSYYARTLNEAPWGEGLILDTGSPDWQIDRDQLLEVKRMIATSGDFGPVIKRKTNPMKTTRAKRKPTPAQLAARERFAEMARSGAFKKAGAKKRKTNPTKKTVSQKISQLTREGYPQKQAVAIALNEERAGKVRRNPIAAPSKRKAPAKLSYGVEVNHQGKWVLMVATAELQNANILARMIAKNHPDKTIRVVSFND